MQQRSVTDIPNAGREPPRGNARVRSRGNARIGPPDLAIFSSSYGYCEGDPEFDERANLVTGDSPECIDVADQSAFMSLFGLSATSVMRAELLWDAENRLAAYIPLNSSGGAKKVTFKYDYRGRRIEKNVYAWNSGGSPAAWYTVPTERRRFLWNGWLLLRETIETDSASDGTFEATRVKTYTWGKDLGGGLESAGGIGGLLAVYDDSATSGSTGDDLAYVYMYDANGNVGQVCDLSQSTASASIVAKYEYDAYGNPTISNGTYASANTYRFSTKPWDDETGLGYWGYRYYDPRLGRWMSRDPIGERGGNNRYLALANDGILNVDRLGLCCGSACTQPASGPYDNTDWAGPQPRYPTNCTVIYGAQRGALFCRAYCKKRNDYDRFGVSACPMSIVTDIPFIGDALGALNKRCSCICGGQIAETYKDPTAAQIITDCVIAHEAVHDISDPDCTGLPDCHSNSALAEAVCIAKNAHRCNGSRECLKQLLDHLRHVTGPNCHSDIDQCTDLQWTLCRCVTDSAEELLKDMVADNAPDDEQGAYLPEEGGSYSCKQLANEIRRLFIR